MTLSLSFTAVAIYCVRRIGNISISYNHPVQIMTLPEFLRSCNYRFPIRMKVRLICIIFKVSTYAQIVLYEPLRCIIYI